MLSSGFSNFGNYAVYLNPHYLNMNSQSAEKARLKEFHAFNSVTCFRLKRKLK
jgi:hypothetical protein